MGRYCERDSLSANCEISRFNTKSLWTPAGSIPRREALRPGQPYRLKAARHMAAPRGGHTQYFGERMRTEDLARQMLQRNGIQGGLVCVFATVEPCRRFSRGGARGPPASAVPACPKAKAC